ncbi:uncharacterized protein J3D65DRAFT_170189 [Phyllosticta citribraziliensis]|uniref:Ysc84 actin-binding domain-containing protein n=1 Tax=Phyllosticta citribraziliensis TaxID=989973 RepID=A0ABR1L799_9PEZI
MWQRTKHGSKASFDKLWGWADKLGAPVNRLSNKLGSEAFWPTTLDKESDKAARILRSFCSMPGRVRHVASADSLPEDGFYEEELLTTIDGPKQKQKVLKKIPAEVIRNAKGLAIFTTMRSGLWISGAGGSGILVGRMEDGNWSPPSGIMLHTAGLGFLVGVDIYDCVVVINTQQALEAFAKVRCTLGGEVSAVAGPLGVGGIVETEVHKRQAPVFNYMKSRGLYAGVQIDGTVVIERTDENEKFYGERLGLADILAGKVANPPLEIRTLMETIKAAQGDAEFDQNLLPSEPPPSDFELDSDHIFGVPDKMDPDPYGVLALEKQGFHIVEAGTHKRPTSEQFEFNPSPQSPIFSTFSRRSVDGRSIRTTSRRSSWRASTLSTSTVDRGIQTCDMGIQTDVFDTHSINSPSMSATTRSVMAEIPEDDVLAEPEPLPKQGSAGEVTQQSGVRQEKHVEQHETEAEAEAASRKDPDASESDDDDDDFEDVEEPVVAEVQQATQPQAIRARLVTVTKPAAPKLPPRNPIRNRKGPLVINADPENPNFVHEASASPRSPMSSSERPSASTIDSASSFSSRDSVSSVEAVSENLDKTKLEDVETVRGSVNEDRSRYFDKYYPSPASSHGRKSPVSEDFS